MELEFTAMEGAAKSGDELATEDAAKYGDGQKERWPGGDPACVIRTEAASGDYTVDMRMKLQALIPTVEHAEETDFGAEMPRVAGDLKEGLGTGVKEQVVDEPFVLQGERSQFPRQREDSMDVGRGQQLLFARLEPAPACVALAPRAMAISTRVI